MSSRACGYSPHEAADPASVSCRDTAHWSGSSATGADVADEDDRAALPDRRDGEGDGARDPDRLEGDVRAAPSVRASSRSPTSSPPASMTSVAPISVARASRPALRSTATIRSQPAARRPAMTRSPMSPAPTTRAEPAPARGCARHGVQRDRERLRQGGRHHRGPGPQPMDDARRDGDPLGERPVAPPLARSRRRARGGRRTGSSGRRCRTGTARSRRCCRT